MRAPHSSSALALNAFYPWRTAPEELALLGISGFKSLVFEGQCPTGLQGKPPHLDVLLQTDNAVIGIESKCTEYLVPKPAAFPDSYQSILDNRKDSSWFRLLCQLKQNPRMFSFLDVAQLIKHYLGLRRCYPQKSVILLYLYWEPLNVQEFEVFQRHRDELIRFAELVNPGDGVRFEHLGYLQLWQEWQKAGYSHVSRLLERYAVSLLNPAAET